MIWYVALVAVLNIGLGYALAVYLGAVRERYRLSHSDTDSMSFDEFDNGDEFYADHYEAEAEEIEPESTVAQ